MATCVILAQAAACLVPARETARPGWKKTLDGISVVSWVAHVLVIAFFLVGAFSLTDDTGLYALSWIAASVWFLAGPGLVFAALGLWAAGSSLAGRGPEGCQGATVPGK